MYVSKSVTLAALCTALFVTGSMAPAGAQVKVPPGGSQAVLSVNATVVSGCEILVPKPFVLTMSYAPLLDLPTLGTSSFTYICTSGTSVSVTPTSSNCASSSSSSSSSSCIGPNWEALSNLALTQQQQPPPLTYTLWNNTTCSDASSSSSSQLSNGVAEQLGVASGLKTIYDICGIPNTGQPGVPAGTYLDQVTFTFNLLQTLPVNSR